jgi:predicted RNA binding protein YcfA (HicA-like mRNA interferase family)
VRLPRDLGSADLARAPARLGYEVTRQTGGHLRLTTTANGEHHATAPAHDPLRVGTLAGIPAEVAVHHGVTREQLLRRLFGS